MKVVLDTNIFVSGIHWKGNSEKILKSWYTGEFTLISSIPIIDELIEVLKEFKKPLSIEKIKQWEDLILDKAILVVPTIKIDIVKDDSDDNKFIEAALEGKAKFIVTQDNDLLRIKEYENIKIINTEEFLKLLNYSR